MVVVFVVFNHPRSRLAIAERLLHALMVRSLRRTEWGVEEVVRCVSPLTRLVANMWFNILQCVCGVDVVTRAKKEKKQRTQKRTHSSRVGGRRPSNSSPSLTLMDRVAMRLIGSAES